MKSILIPRKIRNMGKTIRIPYASAIQRKSFRSLTALCIKIGLLFMLPANISKAADVTIVGDQPIVFIDGTKSSGSVMINLRNASDKAINILLYSRNITSETTKKVISGKIQFKKLGSNSSVSLLKTSLQPDSLLMVELEVINFTDAGEAKAYLVNDKDTVATIYIINKNIPFNISLEASNPNVPEIILKKSKPALIVLKNQDAMNYLIDLSVFIPESGMLLSDSMIQCPGNSITNRSFNIPDRLFTSWFSSLFRDQEKQGQLILRYRASGYVDYTLPVKMIPVKIKVQNFSDSAKYWLGSIIILLVLFTGGIASCLLNLWMPNKLKRLDLLKQLNKLAIQTHSISDYIDSDLRVGIRVERLRLAEMVNSVKAFSPEAIQILESYKSEIDTLSQRIEIIQKLDIVTHFFESFKGKAFGAPAKKMDEVKKLLNQATESMKLVLPDAISLNQAKENIRLADEKLNNMSKEDPVFAKELSQMVIKLIEVYAGLDEKASKYTELKVKLKDLLSLLLDKENAERYKDETKISPEHYHWLSSSIESLFVLRHYINTWEKYEDRRDILQKREPDFIKYLNNRTWYSLDIARQFRFEFEENVFADQIKEAIQKKEFYINYTPTRQPKPNERVCIEVVFDNPELNLSSARNEIVCEWDFGNAGFEKGWKISHYFRKKSETKFKTMFYDEKGKPILFAPKNTNFEETSVEAKVETSQETSVETRVELQDIKEKKSDEQTNIEIIKFSIAFIIAIIALFTGAKEQILKLDLVSGLIAVFLLGFGADAIKNYVTKSPQKES